MPAGGWPPGRNGPAPMGRLVDVSMLKIVSGGQTGVDRAALDAAIYWGLPHGGWCPRGRRAEDGRIPARYQLKETEQRDYAARTERNVVDSDATLIVYRDSLSGGTEFTYRMTCKHHKPCLRCDLNAPPDPYDVLTWLRQHLVAVLNVAGPREQSSPGIGRSAYDFLTAFLDPQRFDVAAPRHGSLE